MVDSNVKRIEVPFDFFTDCEYQNGEFCLWGYDSRTEFKIQKHSFGLQSNEKADVSCSFGANLKFGNVFPMNEKYQASYARKNGLILCRVNEKVLLIQPYSKKKHINNELALICEYLKIHSKYEIFGLFVRMIYWLFFSHCKLQKKTLILCDRRDRVGDNAEALFRYLIKEHLGEYDLYFALSKKSNDWKRMRQYGNVVSFDSIKYMKLYWSGALVVSSYADLPIWMPFRAKGYDTYKDIALVRKIVFLQHGVIKDDLSKLYNAVNTPCSLFVTTTVPEYKSLLCDSYGFIDNQVKLTGLPRYDLLVNNANKNITFMPTWRVSLASRHAIVENFNQSEFYHILDKLLMKPEVADLAEKYGYVIQLMQHPKMETARQYLNGKFDKRIKILPYDTKYSEIFAKSSLIITDYSSVAFDFAYLRKPVLYYQEDNVSFFSGSHNYTRGYFDYEKDGFGEVLLAKEDLLKTLEDYLKNDCTIKPKYLKRINNTFCFNDRNNSERVYQEIKKLY